MTRIFCALIILAFLTACGGGKGSRYSSYNATGARAPIATNLFATGPISQACQAARRKAASRARCGCVQAVANQSLSTAEQRRGAAFFSHPQTAQDVRQSDNPANERFWKKWKAYSVRAGKLCK